jgi:two-component system response regulator
MQIPEAIEILLIEDNDSDAELTIRALNQNHLSNRVVHFADGPQALNYLFPIENTIDHKQAINPKVIMLDLKLPGMSGLDVLKAIKKDPRTRLIPVVVLTSSTEEKDILKSYELGANSFISKPVGFDKFTESMKNLGMYWLLLNKTP